MYGERWQNRVLEKGLVCVPELINSMGRAQRSAEDRKRYARGNARPHLNLIA